MLFLSLPARTDAARGRNRSTGVLSGTADGVVPPRKALRAALICSRAAEFCNFDKTGFPRRKTPEIECIDAPPAIFTQDP